MYNSVKIMPRVLSTGLQCIDNDYHWKPQEVKPEWHTGLGNQAAFNGRWLLNPIWYPKYTTPYGSVNLVIAATLRKYILVPLSGL